MIDQSQFTEKSLPVVLITAKKRGEIPFFLVVRNSQATCQKALVEIQNKEMENFPI